MEHGIVSVAGGVGDGNAVVDEEVLDLWSLIRETKAQKRKELNVSNRGLVDLPVEICSLYSLKKLSLHHNKLHTLPTCISHLTSLRVLTLYTNNLRTLPSSIGHLMLQKLSLSHNQLQFLPPEITKLTNLQYLSLNNNKLGHFPPQLCELVNLKELYLSNNQIKALPISISSLSQLEKLYLDGNQLRTLPVQISSLQKLQRLYLYCNQIVSLPSEIGALSQLTRLYLHSNQLISLPASISNLQEMELLDFFDNPLRWNEEGRIKRGQFPTLKELSATALMGALEDDEHDLDIGVFQKKLPLDLLEYLKEKKRCDGQWCRRVFYSEGVQKVVKKEWKGLSFPVTETYCRFACVLHRQGNRPVLESRKKKKTKKALSRARALSPEDIRHGNIRALDLRANSTSPPRKDARGYFSS